MVTRPVKSADTLKHLFLEKKKAGTKPEGLDKNGLERIKLTEVSLTFPMKKLSVTQYNCLSVQL